MPETLHVLHYDYVENIVERRQPYRSSHLEIVERWHADGRLYMGGAVGDPPHSGMIVFRTAADAEEFANGDPYVESGIVTGWRVEPWTVVTPLR